MHETYEAIVIGSGAGGGAIAHELTKKGRRILIIEAGPVIKDVHLGNFWQVAVFNGYYKKFGAFNMSRELTTIYCSANVGGTTVFSCGNMTRSLEEKFLSLGIDLKAEFLEAENDLCVEPLLKKKIVGGSKAIAESAQRLGYNMTPMCKGRYSDSTVCDLCGNCVLGCRRKIKWDARYYIKKAISNGATLMHSTKAEQILFSSSGQVRGVQIVKSREKKEIECKLIILSAGALNTPIILQKSGILAGKGLFIDFFNVTYGIVKNSFQVKGISMSAIAEFYKQGFILSPFIDHWSQQFLFCPLYWNIIYQFSKNRIIGIMTKIADERIGSVEADGLIKKAPTKQDDYRLKAGAVIAREILLEAGAKNIITTNHPRGAHPGGTAAIGEVVDEKLKVYGREGLYVCDVSVFPAAPGLPPILTTVALAKRLAKNLL